MIQGTVSAKLPPYTLSPDPDHAGELQACFNLDSYKSLLTMTIDLSACQLQKQLLLEQIVSQQDEISNLLEVKKVEEENIQILQDDNTRLEKMWSEENLKRHKAEESQFGSWLSWGLVAGFGVSTLVLGAVIAFKN